MDQEIRTGHPDGLRAVHLRDTEINAKIFTREDLIKVTVLADKPDSMRPLKQVRDKLIVIIVGL